MKFVIDAEGVYIGWYPTGTAGDSDTTFPRLGYCPASKKISHFSNKRVEYSLSSISFLRISDKAAELTMREINTRLVQANRIRVRRRIVCRLPLILCFLS